MLDANIYIHLLDDCLVLVSLDTQIPSTFRPLRVPYWPEVLRTLRLLRLLRLFRVFKGVEEAQFATWGVVEGDFLREQDRMEPCDTMCMIFDMWHIILGIHEHDIYDELFLRIVMIRAIVIMNSDYIINNTHDNHFFRNKWFAPQCMPCLTRKMRINHGVEKWGSRSWYRNRPRINISSCRLVTNAAFLFWPCFGNGQHSTLPKNYTSFMFSSHLFGAVSNQKALVISVANWKIRWAI